MNYGKNQQALLKFLQKHPNKWHRIKRKKAIDSAKSLMNYGLGVMYASINCKSYVQYSIPQMLQDQA